ncbi:MAG: aspartate 1-decarboxylase [Gloeomargarita sp. SKYBB_i_bin120]|nr:aspartate 1-decarboxylase [Gloeomargarita sp. SKYG98]MCS7292254.1 aspartate 1-decarboxylase [Gloeomargarita sp. SKYB120]MDW8177815.1 aspartate 1-decarboxylase [Gloeomargarita sp. SKYBB_i_bin120]
MWRVFLLSKLHNARLTGTYPDYTGSIAIDADLLDKAGILPYEQVQVANISNGQRLVTYAIPAPAGSGRVELNGAAAHCGQVGDRLIIMTYGLLPPERWSQHIPRVLQLDEQNRVMSADITPLPSL